MKRNIKGYLNFQIESTLDEKNMIPSIGGFFTLLNKEPILIDFNNKDYTITKNGRTINFSIEMEGINFLSPEIENDEIESDEILFEKIKNSEEITGFYISVFTADAGDNFYEGEIHLTRFDIVDILQEETINMLGKKVNGILPEAV